MPHPVPCANAAVAQGSLCCHLCDAAAGAAALAFLIARPYNLRTLGGSADVHVRKQIRSRIGIGGALPGRPNGHAQAAPVTYWLPGWPIGFGGDPAVDPGSNTYGNFPSFDGSDARGGGFSYMRNLPNGWFVGGEGGGMGLSMNGINQNGAFGRSLYYQGVQFGYNFKNAGELPFTVYAGFDTLKYNSCIWAFRPLRNHVRHTARLSRACGRRIPAGAECQPVTRVRLHPAVRPHR